ncbi:methyltransferase family protein [Flavobacteriaceae bacterium MAR_2010_72]|nr:methyltransferase family protein [Flavobacteriaceae bacterium MAR_2010_72]TVZ58298.1 methyltransferase family protein [Flavobacteriaceae bacterium MAR_2010_105]
MKGKNVFLTVKDHSVSGEEFQLVFNEEGDLLKTTPRPSLEKLPEYYKSEHYISHTDGKRNLVEIIYQIVKSFALKRKLKLINSLKQNRGSLLDVGCGTGDFLKIAQQDGWQVTGIEPNDKARLIANTKTKSNVFDSEELFNLNPSSFDVISLWHVFEHLPKLEEHLSRFNKLLKPNGTLIIAVPNYKSYDARHYKNFWAAYDVPRHLWHFSKRAIARMLKTENMEVTRIDPMIFDSYYVSLLSEKFKSGTMNPIKAFWVGWRSNTKAKRTGEYSSLIYIMKRTKT